VGSDLGLGWARGVLPLTLSKLLRACAGVCLGLGGSVLVLLVSLGECAHALKTSQNPLFCGVGAPGRRERGSWSRQIVLKPTKNPLFASNLLLGKLWPLHEMKTWLSLLPQRWRRWLPARRFPTRPATWTGTCPGSVASAGTEPPAFTSTP